MTNPHIDHSHLASFADSRVNLPAEDAKEYREQVNRLRDRLAAHIAANPGFDLHKMLHSGSVAKGTALRTINDMDVAVYVQRDKAPLFEKELVPWLAARLREAYSNLASDQFDETQPNCVTLSFKGSGLDVDVVPVLYEGEEASKGYLVDQESGERRLTSIPLHLEFIRARKKASKHYAQVVRLAKWWAKERKAADPKFKCKSFLIELLLAKQVDDGTVLDDYPSALNVFFSAIVATGLERRVAFIDYYLASALPSPSGAAIEVFDPVNPENNITSNYTAADRTRLVDAAEAAGDAISEALHSTTKARAVECWQRVFGPSFRG